MNLTPEQLTSIGVSGLLAVIVIAFYTDRIITKKSSQEREAVIVAMWQQRFADQVAQTDGWKAQAQQLAPAVEKMADELEIANQRDERWRQAFESGGDLPDRRKT